MYIQPPPNNKPLTLFEYSVRRVISRGIMDETYTHAAWANLIFDYEKDANMRSYLMSIVKHEYSYYFSEDLQYKFLEENIEANFPYLFGIEEKQDLFDRMLRALKAECVAQKDPRNQKRYRVSSCTNISVQDGQYVYKAQLIVDEGEDPHFSEGVSFKFITVVETYTCDVVEFDYANATLFFSSAKNIYVTHDSRIVSDATMNTVALMKLLEDISKTIENSINELKKIFNEINEEKVELKLNISKIFTKIRNTINEREDEILSEIDKIYEKSFFKEDIIKIGEKLPNQIKIALEKGNTLCKEWDDNKNKLNSKINDCIYIENNIKNISEIKNNIDKCNSKKINIKFIPSDESINKYLKEIKEFGDLYDLEKVTLEFKFKPGSNYEVTNDGYVATKNKGDNSFNCTIIGDKEIPKHKLSKWKIKLNNIMEENMDILIGIGPDNPNNEINFYLKCWTFSTFNSNLVLKSEDYIDYNNQSKKLKKGDIVEVLVDRKKGNLYFSVNDLNYGIASSEIPKDETLYPIIMIHDQKMSVEII